MPERCALVLDRDTEFSALVQRSLVASGLKVQVVGDIDNGIDRIVDLRPELVFIAVDLPDRNGFALCNKTKGLVKGARVVLATSTIPWREMELHQKLKVHADLYVDKRSVTEAELSRKVEGLLGPPPPDARARVVETEEPDAVGVDLMPPPLDGNSSGGTDIVSFLAELEATPLPGDSLPSAPAPPTRDEELERLQAELDDARRDARRSPFSKDFIELRERLSEKEAEVAALRREATSWDRQMAALKRKARDVLQPLAEELKEKTEETKDLASRLGLAESALWKALEDRQALEDRHAVELRDAIGRFADEQTRSRDIEARLVEAEARRTEAEQRAEHDRKAMEVRLNDLEASHMDALRKSEHDHLSAVVDLETQLAREKGQESEAVRAEWEQKVAAAQSAAAETVAALRRSHAEEMATIDAAHREELAAVRARLQQHGDETQQLYESRIAEAQKLHAESRRHAEEEHALVVRALETRLLTERGHALESLKAEWQDKLDRARREQERALDAAAKEYEDNVAALHVVHREALANQDSEHQQLLRRAAEERDSLRATLQQQEQDLRRRYEARLAEMQVAQAEARKQATENQLSALKAIEESQADKDRAVATARHEAERVLNKLRQDHANAVAAAQKQLAAQAEGLEAEKRAMAARDKELRDTLMRAAEETTALRGESARRERELTAEHQRQLDELQGELRRRAQEERRAALAAAEENARTKEEETVSAIQASHKKNLARLEAEQAEARQQAARERTLLEERMVQRDQEIARLDQELARREQEATRREQEMVRRDQELLRRDQEVATLRASHEKALAAHEKTVDAHEKALGRKDDEYGTALKRAAAELDSLKGTSERREQELLEKLSQLEAATHDQAIARQQAEQALEKAEEAKARAARQGDEQAAALKRMEAERAALEKAGKKREQELLEKLSQLEAAAHDEAIARQQAEQALAAARDTQAKAAAQKAEEHAAALKRAVDERAVLQKKLERREQELTAQLAQTEAGAQAEARRRADTEQRSLAAVEMRLHAEKEQALATLHGAQRQMLADKEAEHRAALKAAEEELKNLQRRNDTLTAEALSSARKQAEEEKGFAVAAARTALEKAHEQRLEEQRLEWEKKLERARLEHADAMTKVGRRFERQAEDAQATQAQTLQRAESEARDRYEAKVSELEANYARACRRAEQLAADVAQREQDAAALRAAHNALMSAEGELRAALQRASEEINDHRTALQGERELRRTHETERAERQAALDKSTQEIQNLRAEQAGSLAALQKHHQERIASLDERHKEALTKKQDEIDLLRRAVDELAGLQAAVEQLRQRYPDAFKEIFSKKAPSGSSGGKKRTG